MTPNEYLKSLGWTNDPHSLDWYIPTKEYRIYCDDDGDWELFRLNRSVPIYAPTDKEGTGLHSLQHALADLNLIDPVKFRVEELLDVLKPMIDKNRSEFLLFLDLTQYLRETSGKPPL